MRKRRGVFVRADLDPLPDASVLIVLDVQIDAIPIGEGFAQVLVGILLLRFSKKPILRVM